MTNEKMAWWLLYLVIKWTDYAHENKTLPYENKVYLFYFLFYFIFSFFVYKYTLKYTCGPLNLNVFCFRKVRSVFAKTACFRTLGIPQNRIEQNGSGRENINFMTFDLYSAREISLSTINSIERADNQSPV